MMRLLPLLLCFAGLTGLHAQEAAAAPAAEPAPSQFQKTDGYPFDTCIVSDEDLDESGKVFTVDGNTFKTCCKKCQAKVEKDPKTYVAKLEAAVIQAQSGTYALTTCPVSGKTLNDKAVSVVVDDTLIKLCCGGCKDKLMADSAKAVAAVQAAAFAKQAANYTAKTCPVSGHDLDENAVSVMHGTTLIKLCCDDCMKKLAATPNAMAAKVAPKAKTGNHKTEGKGEDKGEDKGGERKGGEEHGKAPAAAMAAPGAASNGTGGAACCETGKAESGCCQAGGSATGSATGAAKPGCCQGEASKKAEKTECCETGAAGNKVEAKTEAKVEKKVN